MNVIPQEFSPFQAGHVGSFLRWLKHEFMGLVVPSWCVGCGADGFDMCPPCREDFRYQTWHPTRVEEHADALPVVGVVEEVMADDGIEVLPTVAAGSYESVIAEAIIALKDHERMGLEYMVGQALQRACAEASTLIPAHALIVHPPASPRSMLRRGRAPLRGIIRSSGIAQYWDWEPRVVRYRRERLSFERLMGKTSSSQKSKSQTARRRRRNPYVVGENNRPALAGRPVVIVDDVLTTGSTVHQLYLTLTAAGADVVAAVVIAAVIPQGARAVPLR